MAKADGRLCLIRVAYCRALFGRFIRPYDCIDVLG